MQCTDCAPSFNCNVRAIFNLGSSVVSIVHPVYSLPLFNIPINMACVPAVSLFWSACILLSIVILPRSLIDPGL